MTAFVRWASWVASAAAVALAWLVVIWPVAVMLLAAMAGE